jgi:signal transduction histidine kinase
MTVTLLTIALRTDHDVVLTRQRARDISGHLGFDNQDQIRIATAVSEIARNAIQYAGGGQVEFIIDIYKKPQMFYIVVTDEGPGIADIAHVLSGSYESKTGMGLGIIGARRLMEQFSIENLPHKGLRVRMGKTIPASVFIDAKTIQHISEELLRKKPGGLIEELQLQNLEMMQAMDELKRKQEELLRLNQELVDTNRGVVALYTELDEKARHLRQADELKTKFLSNMSHEFRTPLNSIISLTRLLLSGVDGTLHEEQKTQVSLIAKSAEDLLGLVTDLLDLAKIEAGKVTITPSEFHNDELFSALRGMLRPMLLPPTVDLIFEEEPGIPVLYTDQGKVSQILRNLISNSIKFTSEGEIRISARLSDDKQMIRYIVSDTGVGIDPAFHDALFGEFVQGGNTPVKPYKGSGLGLSISKRLATLLGGSIRLVESSPGKGSVFEADIPIIIPGAVREGSPEEIAHNIQIGKLNILLIDDDPKEQYFYDNYLKDTRFNIVPVFHIKNAKKMLEKYPFDAIILDLLIPGDDSWEFLEQLKKDPVYSHIPVFISSVVDEQERGLTLELMRTGSNRSERRMSLRN